MAFEGLLKGASNEAVNKFQKKKKFSIVQATFSSQPCSGLRSNNSQASEEGEDHYQPRETKSLKSPSKLRQQRLTSIDRKAFNFLGLKTKIASTFIRSRPSVGEPKSVKGLSVGPTLPLAHTKLYLRNRSYGHATEGAKDMSV